MPSYSGGVHCPVCRHDDTKVIDSRPADEGAAIRRRRSCPECSYRFTTYERLEGAPLMVLKRSGDRQPFDRAKVAEGIRSACKGRPVSEAQVDEIARAYQVSSRTVARWLADARSGAAGVAATVADEAA